MFEIKIDGIKEVVDTLNHLQKNVEELEEKKEISIEELLNEEFMDKYTKWNNFNDFIINSKLVPEGTTVLTKEIFEAIPDKEFNEYRARLDEVYRNYNEITQYYRGTKKTMEEFIEDSISGDLDSLALVGKVEERQKTIKHNRIFDELEENWGNGLEAIYLNLGKL